MSVDPPGDDDAVVVVGDDLVGVDEDVGDGGGVLVEHPRGAVDVFRFFKDHSDTVSSHLFTRYSDASVIYHMISLIHVVTTVWIQ